MPRPRAFPLADCPDAVLQRIVDLSDASDLFLLRQVDRRFRAAVAWRITRIWPATLDAGLAAKFPNDRTLGLERCHDKGSQPAATPTLAVLAQLTGLQDLRLGCKSLDNDGPELEWPASLQGLTQLSFSQTSRLEERQLVGLARSCQSLQRLQLSFCKLPWTGLQAVVECLAGTLTELELCYVTLEQPVPALGLRTLNTGRLRTLRLHNMSDRAVHGATSVAFYGQVAAFTSLHSLELGDVVLDGSGLGQLNALTGLTYLSLWSLHVTSASLAQLSRLAELGYKSINTSSISTALCQFDNLTALSIPSGRLEWADGFSQVLAGVTRLSVASVAPAVLTSLTQLQKLKLTISHESQLACLSALVHLTALCLTCPEEESRQPRRDVVLSTDSLRPLLQLTALQCLCTRAEAVMDDRKKFRLERSAVALLAQMPTLRVMDLTQVALPAKCNLRPLERLRLQWLRLPEVFISIKQRPAALRLPILKSERPSRGFLPEWSD